MQFPDDADLAACLLQDRRALRQRLQGLRRRARQGQPHDQGLARLLADLSRSRSVCDRRRAAIPAPIPYPPELPVSERRDEVAALIQAHQVIVLCGETGSGKSTQLPKLCLDLGRGIHGRIGHTQPRRIAARTLASRIGRELAADGTAGEGDEPPGQLVGYKVRFHDRIRPETAIKLMTDGILLAEIQQDPLLLEYDTLIIDEAHERSLNIDFLLGYLKGLLPRRPELKLIVTSATIDPQRFARQFADAQGNPAPTIEISGRTWPVEIRYRPPAEPNAGERDEAMQQAISDAVAELARAGRGDVLVFLSGEREIRETAETLRRRHPPGTEILPLFARQGPREQARVFQPHGARRVILATNVAETSLTVPGIHYVVDPGFARIGRYSHRTQVQRLPVERIAQASANQRAGRCGRVAAGICVRLYDEDSFAARAPFTPPEILRSNLAAVILRMKLLGFGDIERFPFLDPPDPRLIADGYRTLEELAALDPATGDPTPLGRQLGQLPVDPRLGRILLAAVEQRCLAEALIVAAALGVQDPRERPLERQAEADGIHATFRHPDSDFLTYLNLWNFLERERKALSRNQFVKLCQRHFLSWTRVQEWRDIHAQLREQLLEMGFRENEAPAGYAEVHRALLAGLLGNVGFRDGPREYQGTRNSRFHLHPGSSLVAAPPKWLLVAERVETARQYGRTAARVQPEWIEEMGRHLLQRSYSEPHWQPKSGQVAAYERVTLWGLTLVPKRRVNYGPIDPVVSREIFLRFALVEGTLGMDTLTTRAPFWRHNRELIEYVRHLEAKSRRRDILVDEEALYAFYDQRVPTGIYSAARFDQWLKRASRDDPRLLHLGMADLMLHEAAGITAEAFPDRLQIGAAALPLDYRFEPGAPDDGLTLRVPLPLLNQVTPDRLDWLVPGLLEERVAALLRGLPKSLRKAFVPIPDTAARVVARLTPSERPLIQALGETLRALTGVQVPEDAWDLSALPEHLRLKVRLIDGDGQTLAVDADPLKLRRAFGGQARRGFAALPAGGLERESVRRWDFGDLPESVELERGGIRLRGFPALVAEADGRVALRVLDAPETAELAHRHGVRRLLLRHLGDDARRLRQGLAPNLVRWQLQYAKAPAGVGAGSDAASGARPADLADELLALILDLSFLDGQPPLREQAAFLARLAAGRARLPAATAEAAALIGGILELYQPLSQRLSAVTQVHWLPAARDMRAQLDRLVYRGFPLAVPIARLRHYPRYLKGIGLRLERLTHAAARDRQRMDEMADLQARWNERAASAQAAGRRDPRLEEIRWLLEELRVSLFAQSLGTAEPVSVKRVAARWRELGL